jgi:hypothetical protein
MRRSLRPLCIVALFTLTACHSSTPAANKSADAQPALPSGPVYRHRPYASGVSPAIVSLTPDTVAVRSGHAYFARYTLEYDILGIDKVKGGHILVYAPGVGQIQSIDIQVQQHGTVEFILDPESLDFGPTLRVRAHCPAGTTEWRTLGEPTTQYDPHAADTLAITNLTPEFVARDYTQQAAAAAVELTFWGKQISKDCTAEAELDGTTIQLQNPRAMDKQIKALLLRSDLQGRPIASRYFTVSLVLDLNPNQMRVADQANLPFREL